MHTHCPEENIPSCFYGAYEGQYNLHATEMEIEKFIARAVAIHPHTVSSCADGVQKYTIYA